MNLQAQLEQGHSFNAAYLRAVRKEKKRHRTDILLTCFLNRFTLLPLLLPFLNLPSPVLKRKKPK